MQQGLLTMDFQKLASWEHDSLLAREAFLKQPMQLQDQWLACCRAWIDGGPSPDDYDEIQEIIDGLHPLAGRLARAYIECARLFRRNPQWTSGTVETEKLLSLHAKGLSPFPHLPAAFLLDLADTLLGRQRPGCWTQPVLFPLVGKNTSVETRGRLARFVLEELEGGEGKVFLDPRQSFLALDADFSNIFRHAPAAVLRLCLPGGDVRVRIDSFPQSELLSAQLEGNSGGGALALGLWSVWTKTRLDASYVTSFALTAPGAKKPDGNCHRIGGDGLKAQEIADRKGGAGFFLVEKSQSEALQSRAEHMKLEVVGAGTFQEATNIISGRLGAVLAYLKMLEKDVREVPPYYPYPEDTHMEQVRVRVRVSAKRTYFDPKEARRREERRRAGLIGDDEGTRDYKHRVPTEEDEQEQIERAKVEDIDWDDEDMRGKIRRGVVVGDPGMGKTWLLKCEAARHAAQAASVLLESGDLERVILPVYRRLSDVAEGLHTLEKRRQHGTTDVPTLVNAVVESLSNFQLQQSQPLPEQVLTLVRERLGGERCLLLLDAYDEVPAKRQDKIWDAVGEWVSRNPASRLLFTSRAASYKEKPPWHIPPGSEAEREMELLPFGDEQIGAFLDAFFARDKPASTQLRDLIRRAPQLRGMAQIPLLLGFLCALHHEEQQKPPEQRRDLTRLRRTDLYDACLRRLLSGQWRDPDRQKSEDDVEDMLSLVTQIGFRLFEQEKELFSRSELADTIKGIWGWPQEELPPQQNKQVAATIRRLSKGAGLLVKAGEGKDARYLFLHLTFQEYLTACHLANLINADGWDTATVLLTGRKKPVLVSKFLDGRAWVPGWQEVIVLLAGKLDDPVPLLELLADESKDDLFHHRLALAARCLPEIQALLDAAK